MGRREANKAQKAMSASVQSIEQLLTPKEVAERLRMSPRTIARLGIPCIYIGTGRKKPRRRYRSEDLEKWLQNRRVVR